MESLLRLSGLLSEDEAGKAPDLLTLEKRLADRSGGSLNDAATKAPNRPVSTAAGLQSSGTGYSTPHIESQPSPQTTSNSPESQDGNEYEVEALSDMMCALVTNNSGETRYIGRFFFRCVGAAAYLHCSIFRFIVRLFDIFSKRNSMGE
jgi:hypothetical protein